MRLPEIFLNSQITCWSSFLQVCFHIFFLSVSFCGCSWAAWLQFLYLRLSQFFHSSFFSFSLCFHGVCTLCYSGFFCFVPKVLKVLFLFFSFFFFPFLRSTILQTPPDLFYYQTWLTYVGVIRTYICSFIFTFECDKTFLRCLVLLHLCIWSTLPVVCQFVIYFHFLTFSDVYLTVFLTLYFVLSFSNYIP